MSLLTNEISSDSESMVITESNKRKFDEIDMVLKKCKLESPTTTTAFVDEQSNSILTDVTDNESTDSSDRSDKPMSFTTTTSTATTPTNSNDCDNDETKKEQSTETIVCPQYGQIVNRRQFRRAGPYIIGLKLGHSPVDSIVQYLAKKENTNEFVQLKILMLNNNQSNEKLQRDERQGKMLLHTEFSLLSLLRNEKGVIQQHGLFSDVAHEEVMADNGSNNNFFTGGLRKRLILVLDCVTPHDFDPQSSAYVNLQQYLINRRKLTEMEALTIFYEIVSVVENLHKRNIIHRDLKLGNIVLNKDTNKIKITNFCLGKYLLSENDLLYDQRGSPAYISPDVLCGKPYKGKPSDMWALGVVLFMMLYRQFPFFESTPTALFKKIKSAEYFIPMNYEMSKSTESIIKGLLQLNPEKRLTATQVREKLKAIIDSHNGVGNNDHLVPEMEANDDNYSVPTETPSNDKWQKLSTAYSFNDRDQVVPSMGSPNPPIPSRKRRRSSDNVLNDISQRGISVQHVNSDARQLNENDISQLAHVFRVTRNRLGELTLRPSPTASPSNTTTYDRNRTPNTPPTFQRQTPLTGSSNRVQDLFQFNIANRTNRNSLPNMSRIERPTMQSSSNQSSNPRSNLSQNNWPYLRVGNSGLSDLFRCAVNGVSPRNQQSTDASRQSDQIRLLRRIRRSWAGNNHSSTNTTTTNNNNNNQGNR